MQLDKTRIVVRERDIFDILDLALHASLVVQLVLIVLILASVLSWTMIFDRARALKRAKREAAIEKVRFVRPLHVLVSAEAHAAALAMHFSDSL